MARFGLSDQKNPPEKNISPIPPPTEPYIAVPKPSVVGKTPQGFPLEDIPPTQKTFLSPQMQAKLSMSTRSEENLEKKDFSETGKFPVLPFIQGARSLISSLSAPPRKNPTENQTDQTDTTLLPLPTLNNSRLFGPYEIVSEIARTPIGNSYKARHINQDRMYFLKILTLEESQTQKLEERLKNTRKLVHPRIVNYTDFGIMQGLFFMAADFIEGEPLKKRMEKYLSIRESLQILHQVLGVLEYAHQQGLVHGSLSSTNIFLTKDEIVRVSDFAVPLVINPALKGFPPTEAGYGALYYRDPRIIQQHQEPDFFADIYSVGSLLYELLTERKPVVGESVEAILMAAHKNLPVLLVEKTVPPGIQMILTRATHPIPQKRYATIRQFMQDVDNFLNYRPLLAEISPLQKIFPAFSLTHRFSFVCIFFVLFVFLMAIPVVSTFRSLSKKIERQEQTIQQQQQQTQQLLAQAFQEKALWLKQTQPAIAGLLAAQSHQMAPSHATQTLLSELYFSQNSFDSPYVPAFAEKQQFCLTPEEKVLTIDTLKGLQQWNLDQNTSPELLIPISIDFPFQNGLLVTTPDFLYCAFLQEIRQYSWKPFQQTQRFLLNSTVSALATTSSFLFAGTQNGTLLQWNLRSGELLNTRNFGNTPITAIAFSESRASLFVALGDQLIFFPVENMATPQKVSPHRKAITQLFVSDSLQLLFSAGLDHRIQALDLNTGNILHTFIGHQGGVVAFQIDLAQNYLYSISNVGELFSWKLSPKIQSERPERAIQLQEKNLTGITLASKNDKLLLNTTRSLYFFKPQTLEELFRWFGFHYFPPLRFTATEKQKLLYFGDISGTLLSWDLETKAPKNHFEGGSAPISAIALDSSQKYLWAGDRNGFVFSWSLETKSSATSKNLKKVHFKAHSSEILDLIATERYLYSSSFPGKLICSDWSGDSPKTVWERPSATSVVLENDQLWAGNFEGNLLCYHPTTGEILGRWEIGKASLCIETLTPDFFYGTQGKRFFLWDIQSKKIYFETEMEDPVLAATTTETDVFLGTSRHLYRFQKNPWKLTWIMSVPQPIQQLQYLSSTQALLVSFPNAGIFFWNNAFLEKNEWLSLPYWEKCSRSKISGFDIAPVK